MKQKVDTVTAGAALINAAADEWTRNDNTRMSLSAVTRRAAKGLSDKPVFNLACFLMYDFGPCLSGEDDDGWLDVAKDISKLLGGK